MNKKEKTITLRISEELLKEYKQICEENGFAMSKKIRGFIIGDLEKMKNA